MLPLFFHWDFCHLHLSFIYLFFLAQTPPLRPCRWAVYLSPPSPVSDSLFMSLCVPPSLSVPPSDLEFGVIRWKMCHADDESSCHSVISSSSSSLPPPRPPKLSPNTAFFLLPTRQTQISHTCRRMVRGAYKRCQFILAQAFLSDRDVKPPLFQKQ